MSTVLRLSTPSDYSTSQPSSHSRIPHLPLQTMALPPEQTQRPPRHLYVLPFPLTHFCLHQTLLQLPRHTTPIPPTWPLLRRLHVHGRPRQRTHPSPQNYPCGTGIPPIQSPSTQPYTLPHTQTIRSSVDPRTPLHFPMAAYAELAFQFPTFEAHFDGWQFSRHRAHFFPRLASHFRLFRRLRRRLHTTNQPILYTSHKLHALTVLRDVTKNSRASFATRLATFAPADTQTWKFTPSAGWLPVSKNQAVAEQCTSSIKH